MHMHARYDYVITVFTFSNVHLLVLGRPALDFDSRVVSDDDDGGGDIDQTRDSAAGIDQTRDSTAGAASGSGSNLDVRGASSKQNEQDQQNKQQQQQHVKMDDSMCGPMPAELAGLLSRCWYNVQPTVPYIYKLAFRTLPPTRPNAIQTPTHTDTYTRISMGVSRVFILVCAYQ